MMKATAQAPVNIALIKYWGKKDEKLRLPANDSLSFNVSAAFSVTSVEYDASLIEDVVMIDGQVLQGDSKLRLTKHVDRIREIAQLKTRARVESHNNFPKGSGIASSASGFAALTLAAAVAADLKLTEKDLSILARIGSGSACRSIPDGWVRWHQGNSSETSYAESLYPADYWQICDLVAVVGSAEKKISSSEGHGLVESSPFYQPRLKDLPAKTQQIITAIDTKDFTLMGQILEAEAINMHAVMMTSVPPLLYWNPTTLRVMHEIISWREAGLEVYFTIDAGPNVHVICQGNDAAKIEKKLLEITGVEKVIVNQVANGAHIL